MSNKTKRALIHSHLLGEGARSAANFFFFTFFAINFRRGLASESTVPFPWSSFPHSFTIAVLIIFFLYENPFLSARSQIEFIRFRLPREKEKISWIALLLKIFFFVHTVPRQYWIYLPVSASFKGSRLQTKAILSEILFIFFWIDAFIHPCRPTNRMEIIFLLLN